MTRREAEVLAAVGERLTNAEIAARFVISERTVESHVASLFRKLGASNRRELATLWKTTATGESGDARALPPALDLLADPATYVGRARERSQLRELWRRSRDGQLLMAVIVGEAGMGKSRIAAELALEAHADRGEVRLGSCLEELAIPYEPFVQILDADAAALTAAELADRVGGSGAVLGRLAPNVGTRLGLTAPRSDVDGPAERAETLAALHDYLDRSTRQASLLLVIEDLHWATATTRDAL